MVYNRSVAMGIWIFGLDFRILPLRNSLWISEEWKGRNWEKMTSIAVNLICKLHIHCSFNESTIEAHSRTCIGKKTVNISWNSTSIEERKLVYWRKRDKVRITWVDSIQCRLHRDITLAHSWIGNFVRCIHSNCSHLSKYFVSPSVPPPVFFFFWFYNIFMVFHFVFKFKNSDQFDPFQNSNGKIEESDLLCMFQRIYGINKKICDCILIRTSSTYFIRSLNDQDRKIHLNNKAR